MSDVVCDVTSEQFVKIMRWLYEHPEYDNGMVFRCPIMKK